MTPLSFHPTTPDPARWDAFVRAHPHGSPLQMSAWATLKAPAGWTSVRIALAASAAPDSPLIAGAQLLFRRLPGGVGTIAYLPLGPLLTPSAHASALWHHIDTAARRRWAVFLKVEPGLRETNTPALADYGLHPSPHTIQPPRTILIDLTADEDGILARMNQGTRRKIRQADKQGVQVITAGCDDVPAFSRMMATTGERNAFGVHDAAYYAHAFDLYTPHTAALFIARHEADDLAGVMVFAVGRTAWYLYGASSSIKRNMMGAYAAQWAAIRWAKARGCTHYDLWGIPDTDEDVLEAQFETRSDGLWGVYGFKRGWGGQVKRSPGAWDRVYNRILYTAYRFMMNQRGSTE